MRLSDAVQKALNENRKINIDIGCGPKPVQGFFGIDMQEDLHPDIVCNLEKEKLPLPDNSVGAVYSCYFLEHINNVLDIMDEIWRVTVPGALTIIIVPHWAWDGQHKDPTHKTTFSEDSYKYWDSRDVSVPHYGHVSKFDLVDLKFRFAPWATDEHKATSKMYRNVIENMTFILRTVK